MCALPICFIHFDDGDGCFRGDSGHRSPIVAVKHQVAYDGNALSVKRLKQGLEPRRVKAYQYRAFEKVRKFFKI